MKKTRNSTLTGSTLVSLFALTSAQALAATAPNSDDALLDLPLEKLMEIETGTRDVGVKAWQSTTPIQVVSAEQLAATGQDNVFDALMALVPSMSWSQNYDLGNVVRSARLRGMSPGEVLVLIDGKRRHPTGRINSTPGTPDQGSNPVDLDLIPLSMIDHVEVLLDGASAQYGTDAVAGVINFILKKPTAEGATLTASGGKASAGDDGRLSAGLAQGIALGSDGAASVYLDYRHQDFAHRTGAFFSSDVQNYSLDYPKTELATAGLNLSKPIGREADFYAFATVASRKGQTLENVRVTSAFDPTVPAADIYPANAVSIFPRQFDPRETVDETDAAFTVGIKGHDLGGWSWDLSTTWGRDNQREGVIDDVNSGMIAATGSSPTSFRIGQESTSQVTTNLDLRKPFEWGALAAPLNVAFGFEHRSETYTEGAGEAASYLYGATAAFAGKSPSDISDSSRNVEAAYVDLSTKIAQRWAVDVAGRYENYSQAGVGSTANGKLSTRYDFTPEFALRATLSNGFHAPTLAQSHFSDTVVYPPSVSGGSPTLSVQLPVASPGGAMLGEPPLKPEKSNNIDFGLVAAPLPHLDITLDAYQIDLSNRIIDTGYIPGPSAPASANALALQALAANGNVIAPGSLAEVQFFTNGVDTRTRGVDFSASYVQYIGDADKIHWQLDGNFNHTSITNVHTPSPTLAAAGITYVNPEVVNDLTAATPASRTSLAANYRKGSWEYTVRETRYGYAAYVSSFTDVPYTTIPIQPAFITDVDFACDLTKDLRLSFGGNNVFNKLPPPPSSLAAVDTVDRDSNRYPINTPWSNIGAYYYVKLTARF
ncbi:MAG: TonB-dependent receptor [Burkholderiaceae bacterium]|nr:TonB-dependent receptor [Burkholderiaceae bacterium]